MERLALVAGKEEAQMSVIVYCRLTDVPADRRPGLGGYARIYTGRRSLGLVLLDRVQRYVRTEFCGKQPRATGDTSFVGFFPRSCPIG